VICAAPLAGQDLVLDLDAAQSHIQFTLGATLHTVHGSFKLTRGTVRFDPATGRISGEIVADATSGESGDQSRDRRMHKDILESARYPEIAFTPDRVEGTVVPQGVSQVQVQGTFRIHGAAHEITIPVEVRTAGAHRTVTARFSIPYAKWGLKNPGGLLLRVSDKVEIDASLSTR
jgi:polyisoprenoid-binding protein YceI